MGSGKSTIGRQLAQTLNKAFHDSDKEIEERTGASISLIFEIEGEPGFRKREQTVINELSQLRDIVLATGGGAVTTPNNRSYLKQRGFVVYLRAPAERLFARTHRDRNRPLLQTAQPRRKFDDMLKQREPLYREVADFIIDTEGRSVKQVIDEIGHAWNP
jgi:shikimate kinase